MKAEAMWSAYGGGQGHVDAWAFGGAPDELAELVRVGKKTATSSAYPLYAVANEPLPQAGEYSVILDSQGNAVCSIRTTKVSITPFSEITEQHAYKEGEGDRSLTWWRTIHETFFSHELNAVGLAFSPDMPVVCEEFEVVYP